MFEYGKFRMWYGWTWGFGFMVEDKFYVDGYINCEKKLVIYAKIGNKELRAKFF